MTIDEYIEPTKVKVGWVLDALDGKDPKWDELRAKSQVKKCEAQAISGAGFLSNVLKLKILFENGEVFPTILKAPTRDKLDALQADDFEKIQDESEDLINQLLVSYHNQEINFYEQIGNKFNSFPLPQLFGHTRSSIKPLSHGQILLEDVSHLGILANNKVGLNLEQCESVMKAIADFHVFTLCLPNIKEILKSMRNVMDEFNDEEFNFIGRLTSLDPYFAEHKEELKEHLKENSSQVEDPHLRFNIPALLSHGDLWTNNMFFKRNEDGTCGNTVATVLDWQASYPGTGLEDLTRFIYTSASLEVLENHEPRLLKLYFDELNNGLKANNMPPRFATYEKMLEVFKFHRDHEFLFSVFILLTVADSQTTEEERKMTANRLKSTFEKIRNNTH